MAFLNEGVLFEQRGDRYVVRLTPFSAGYDVSKMQKEALSAGLQRIDLRTSIEAVVAFGLIAGLFLTGILRSETPVGWVLVFCALAVVVLSVRSLRQRHRLLRRCVGARPPDFPRSPFWMALWKPRPPLVAERFAVPVLRLATVLLVLLLAGGNVLAAIPVIAAWRGRAAADAPAEQANVDQILSLTLYHDAFWLTLLLFNLVVVAMIVALGIESRRLRRRRHGT